MATGNLITTNGKLIALNRLWKSSPDYSTPSVFKVGTGDTTPTAADTDLDTAVTIGGNPTKSFVAGYPVINETTMQVTTRALLLTTESNGNSITEFGLFNSDGTAKMFSRSVFTPITKTTSVQVIFVEKDKIQ